MSVLVSKCASFYVPTNPVDFIQTFVNQKIHQLLEIPDDACSDDIQLLEFQAADIQETAKKVLQEVLKDNPENQKPDKTRSFRTFSLVAGAVVALGVYMLRRRWIDSVLAGMIVPAVLFALHSWKLAAESQKQDSKTLPRLRLQMNIICEWMQQKAPTIDEKIKSLEATIKNWKVDAIDKPESKTIQNQQTQLIKVKIYIQKLLSLRY